MHEACTEQMLQTLKCRYGVQQVSDPARMFCKYFDSNSDCYSPAILITLSTSMVVKNSGCICSA